MVFTKVQNLLSSTSEKLRIHPGYSYGLGCHEWKSGGFSGETVGWSSHPRIEWSLFADLVFFLANLILDCFVANRFAKSVMHKNNSIADSNNCNALLDLHIIVSTLTDVPHLKM